MKRILTILALALCLMSLFTSALAVDVETALKEQGFEIRKAEDTLVIFYDMANGDINGVSFDDYKFDDDAENWFKQFERTLLIALNGDSIYGGTYQTKDGTQSGFIGLDAFTAALSGSGLTVKPGE